MPTPTAHAVVAITAAYTFPQNSLPRRAWIAGALCAIAPDLDTLPIHFGLSHGGFAWHRGLSHSLVFTGLLTGACIVAATISGRARGRRTALAAYLALAIVLHPLLDMLTDAGSGIELLWPFSDQRFFAPFRPIAASPISVVRFFSARGLQVVVSEFLWIGLPCLTLVAACWWMRTRQARSPSEAQ